MLDVVYHQEYILRKYFSFKDEDFRIVDYETIHRLIEMHNDEEIQHKLDLFGAGGTDLTDPKCGTSFYRNWLNDKHRKEDERKPKTKVKPEAVKRIKRVFDQELNRIMGDRKLRPIKGQKVSG